MLILLDHCAPGPMRAYLPGHIVHTAAGMGWDLRPDGEVLTLAEAHGYELLISVDQDIQYQQNLTVRQIAILVLKPNDWSLIRPRIDDINAAISRIQPGEYIEVDIPMPPLEPYIGGEGNR